MLVTLGITLVTDSYVPGAGNAAGITEMARLGSKTRTRIESLEALGNTTAAIGKGFAIGNAALTSLVLYVTFVEVMKARGVEITLSLTNPTVLVGLFIGGLLPFI